MYPRKRKEKKTRRDEIDGSVDLRVFELMDPSSVRPSERPSQTQLDEKLKGRKRYIESGEARYQLRAQGNREIDQREDEEAHRNHDTMSSLIKHPPRPKKQQQHHHP